MGRKCSIASQVDNVVDGIALDRSVAGVGGCYGVLYFGLGKLIHGEGHQLGSLMELCRHWYSNINYFNKIIDRFLKKYIALSCH